MSKHIVIIGNGIAGTTLARHIRKRSDHRITVISAESPYFFSRPALMYVYMGHMPFVNTQPYENNFWQKNRIELLHQRVTSIDSTNKHITLENGQSMPYDSLVLATGSRPRQLKIEGEDLQGVQGLVSRQDLERMEDNTRGVKEAVVAGGGLIGIEMVEMLRSRDINVHFLIRELKFWNKVLPDPESDMVTRHMQEHGVQVHFKTELKSIQGSDGKVSSVTTQQGENIACGFAGVAAGVVPVTDLAKSAGISTDRGILVNSFLETNVKDIYAIGDCAQFAQPIEGRSPIEQIWYTGRMQGETLAATLCGQRSEYKPKNFFNSAKLFDIEYQVYSRNVQVDEPENDSIYWSNDAEKKCIRIFYRKSDGRFEGLSALGIRYRHEVCDRWLSNNKNVEEILAELSDANFDPEFYTHYEQGVVNAYNKKHGTSISLKKKSWKRILGMA